MLILLQVQVQQEKHEFAKGDQKNIEAESKEPARLSPKKRFNSLNFLKTEVFTNLISSNLKRTRVQKWIKFYTGRGRRHLQKHLDQGYYFKETVTKLLQEEDLINCIFITFSSY